LLIGKSEKGLRRGRDFPAPLRLCANQILQHFI